MSADVRALGHTRGVDFEPEFVAALQIALTPSDADVAVARGVVLNLIGSGSEPVVLTDFEDGWLKALGGSRPAERTQYQAAESTEPGRRLADPDPNDPHLMEFRSRHAIRRAVAQLIAEGVITKADGNQYAVQGERISIQYPGGGSSTPVFVHSPNISEPGSSPRFLAVRPLADGAVDVLLPTEEMVVNLDDVLGQRGIELVRESRRALQRGLFLAASSLLAAASEAAWFQLARAVPNPAPKLQVLVESGRDIAEVIRLVEQRLLDVRARRALITEVTNQAHLFREVRNYALHPVEDHDVDREVWLSETGATLLAIAARRYFVKLDEIRKLLTTAQE